MKMLKAVTTITGPILADYHSASRKPGKPIRIVKGQFIRVVDSEDGLELNPARKEGEPVRAISIPASIISRYQWVERGMVKEVSFRQQTVAVDDDGVVSSQLVDGEKSLYNDNYSNTQDRSVVEERLNQDSVSMESDIDASMVLERSAETIDPDLSLRDQINERISESGNDLDLSASLQDEQLKNQSGMVTGSATNFDPTQIPTPGFM